MRPIRLLLLSIPYAIAPLCWASSSGFIELVSPTSVSDYGTVQSAWAAADGEKTFCEVRPRNSIESVRVYEGKDTQLLFQDSLKESL